MHILSHSYLIPIFIIIMWIIFSSNFFLIKIHFPFFIIIIIKIIIKLFSLIHIFCIIIIVLWNRFWFIFVFLMVMMMLLFLTFHTFLDLYFLIYLFKNLFSSAFLLLTDLWAEGTEVGDVMVLFYRGFDFGLVIIILIHFGKGLLWVRAFVFEKLYGSHELGLFGISWYGLLLFDSDWSVVVNTVATAILDLLLFLIIFN